ncbi:hypothetical protein GO730_02170 [Spirosoma sp. HMF3257]|uniref:TolC family protein n=1 Tax=Spirosoma telluris TaxID=2183553 RepID=A0A327NE04_9BACT|nr:hypothetical protein [Spirosoma telluris]RAI73520.1 hypothetical protein HMF3257_02115 [Spirosoma telluris]
MQATIADEEQNLLKLDIQREDYETDLKRLTGIKADSLVLAPVDLTPTNVPALDVVEQSASRNNVDIQLAELNGQKAQLGIKVAQQSYRPDLACWQATPTREATLFFQPTTHSWV